MDPLTVRPAQPADLPGAYEVFYENEVRGAPDPPPRGAVPPILDHVRATGDLVVAERDGSVVGYAGVVHRGSGTYLSDLFVRPDQQSAAVGTTLLRHVLPADGRARWTLASTDPRALAFARAGMRPLWPNVELRLEVERARGLPSTDIEVVEAQAGDPELVVWDGEIGGRLRPQDHAFWADRQRGVPLWFRRGGETVGYGYVRFGMSTVWTPEKTVVGPVGSRSADDAAACVFAAVAWARPHGSIVDVAVPGPHPSLAPLLEAGFRIIYVETFCASDSSVAVDPWRYLGSGGDLF